MGGTGSIEKASSNAIRNNPNELSIYDDNKGPFYRCDINAEFPIVMGVSGIAALPPTTVMQVFEQAKTKCRDVPALKVERGDNNWKEWTFGQYYDDVMFAARALIKLGMQPFESVNIIGFNGPEWFVANMAAIAAGGKAAGIYTTNGSAACRYITEHSEARVVVLENRAQLDKFLPWRDECKKLSAIVMWADEVPADVNNNARVPVYSWADFIKLGQEPELEQQLKIRIANQRPGHCATLIYTSGTTGNPKAVMLSHDNLTWTAQSILHLFPPGTEGHERAVSYLPLSHIAAQMLDIHAPIALAASGRPFTMFFARPDALKGTLGLTLKAAQPTIFFGVPRVWEKMMEKMKSIGAQTTGLKKSLVDWAKARGAAKFDAEQVQGDGYVPYGFGLADTLIFSKIREALGLSQCRLCLSGAAPISKEVLRYFGTLNIPVCEVYGMSESTGPQTSCRYNYKQIGSCGVNIPGVEMKIFHDPHRDKPEEGEICYRGRHIMMGYMKDPHKTQETIDDQGFLHSGDVGRIDENGLLYITGRIKELIITAGGENVAPVPVEDKIKEELPAISNVMMVGDKRKFNSALVCVRQVLDEKTGEFSDELTGAALEVSSDSKTVAQAMKDPKWQAYVEAGIARANKHAVSNAQKIQKFTIVPRDFSVNGGELTATLKLRRAVVAEMYAKEIEDLYAGSNE